MRIHSSAVRAVASKDERRQRLAVTLMALPFIIIVFAFSYIPLFGWIYAFFNFKPGIPLGKTPFVGLEYFKLIITDIDMVRVLGNTLIMSFLGVACSVLPIVFAIMITELRFSFVGKIVQSATTLPNFISWVIVYSLAYTMFSSDGVVNQILLNIGVISEPTNILGNNGAVWMFQTALGVWKTLGWNAIIYLAAIAGIDDELYDAADIDGAGRFGKIRYITLPGVAPTFFVLLLLAISNILSAGFEQYLVFYNSLVADKIEVIDYYVYRIGIVTNDYSYGTAIGMTKSVVSVLLLFLVNLLSKKVRGSSII